MEIKQALEEVKDLDDTPILRKCAKCKEWLDEISEVIADHRPAIEYIISHGLCIECANEERGRIIELHRESGVYSLIQ